MQRYFGINKIENKLILEKSDLHHIKNVMRMTDDEEIEVVFNKKLYICCISNVKSENIEITIKNEKEFEEKFIPKVTLIIPLLKEQKLDLILQKATELGVYKIVPFIAERSIIKVNKDFYDKKIERWNRILKEAAEQSKRVDIPLISDIKNIRDLRFMDDLNLICSTQEKEKNIKNMMKNNQKYDRINVVVGPEGGLTLNEENILVDQGFNRVSLGNRIMRVETVPIFIMSIINYEYME